MKKALSLALMLCILLSVALTACASTNTQPTENSLASTQPTQTQQTSQSSEQNTTIVLKIGSPTMLVNGSQFPIDDQGTSPVIMNNRTLLPVRALVERLGGSVEWNGDTREVTLTHKGNQIKLYIDSERAYLNGEERLLDVTPLILNNRTMLPIRFIADSFMLDVDWNGTEREVTIMQKEISDIPSEVTSEIKSKSVVVYFSATGNTKALAEKIAQQTESDLFEIVPSEPYTSEDLNYTNDSCRANREQNNSSARPEIANTLDGIEVYSTVFVGYPIWWGKLPKIIYTFLEGYDLSNKVIMPFCTSGGSGIQTSVSEIRSICAQSEVKDGLRGSSSTTAKQIDEWLEKNEFEKGSVEVITQINDGLVLINGGSFVMGSPENEAERSEDEKTHEVSVDSFYLSSTEVTQEEYSRLMGSNPSDNKNGSRLPVENVTWYDAIKFCNKLSIERGLTPCYTIGDGSVSWNRGANGYRLPTEAEWEYASRAGTQTPFWFGDYVNDDDANCYNAYGYNNDASGRWVNGYLGHTVSVDSYNANGNGLYNIHGNVSEWVWDWYGEYKVDAKSNPTGSVVGAFKVARGGGWNDMPKHLRSAYRVAHPADVPLYSIGLRVARNASNDKTDVVVSEQSTKPSNSTGKTLIAYFSQTGNTRGFAQIIEEMTDADNFRIERKEAYSAASNSPILYGEALDELRANERPELKEYLESIDEYDTIFLGYCNWWAMTPAPVLTFLGHYDLSGKTIIPFCSMGGGRFGQTISMIAKNAPNSVIKQGLCVSYSAYDREEIAEWIAKSIE